MSADFHLRPNSLDELVGQELCKQKARISIGAALSRGEPLGHSLLTSTGGGLGKTTFSQILANEMFGKLTCTTGQCISTAADLRNVLVRLEPNELLLVDEFHGIGQLAAEELLLVMEQGVLNVSVSKGGAPVRITLPPFTLLAATTRPSSVSAPLRQRFGLIFHFEFYTEPEIATIVQGMVQRMSLSIETGVALAVAKRALGIPRRALRLLERLRDVASARRHDCLSHDDFEFAMELEGVDCLGLGREERQVLQVLSSSDPRPVSARSLALAVGLEVKTILDVIEPTVLRLGLASIGPGGRRITAAGIDHLRAIEGAGVAR